MARLKFTGPEGAPYCGATLRVIGLGDAEIDHIDDLQRETGASMEDVIEWFDPKKKRAKGAAATFYFTLRNAGMFVSFKEAWGLVIGGEYEQAPEKGDKKQKADEGSEDPTSARTDSAPGSDLAPGKDASRRKPTKTSAKRSTAGS